jgi:hypothetical protein
MIAMTVSGDKALIKKLAELEPKVAKKAIKKGSRAGNKLILETARQTAPTLKKARKNRNPGDLRKAIKVQALKDKKGSYGTRVNIVFKGSTKSNWYYGAWQNYGWTPKARTKAGTYVNGRPVKGLNFMDKARMARGQQALKQATSIISEEIKGGF